VSEPPDGRGSGFARHLLQLFALTLVLSLFGLLAWKIVAERTGANLVASIRAGDAPKAPTFDLEVIWPRAETWPVRLRPALADDRVKLDELRGYAVVLNFWASWCIPCEREAPALAASANAHRGRVAFLGIDIQDFEGDALRFLRRHDAPYVAVRDVGNRLYSSYGLSGIPETYYLDSHGRVIAHSVGEISREDLEAGIAQAVGAR
jgi:cytochrome c biogenesis protein CcmG/thiol:disulfide interchange protein DsbE